MLSKEIKEKVLKEENLDKVLEILKPYKNEDWDEEIIEHLQKIVPDDGPQIDEFCYIRPTKE